MVETGGRTVKACLIHSDLWHENATMDADTGLSIIFDTVSIYEKNKCTFISPVN